MEIAKAREQFRSAAIEKGDFAEDAARDHALHESMREAWDALERRGSEGRAAFCSLLADESHHVRSWAAAQLLALGNAEAIPVLEAEAAESGLRGFSAKMVLQEWKAGRLKPPFRSSGA